MNQQTNGQALRDNLKVTSPQNRTPQQVVRDFVWTISSPPLTDQLPTGGGDITLPPIWSPEMTNEVGSLISSLESDPTPLLYHINGVRSHFIGPYFESLWAFFFNNITRYQLKFQGLQLHYKGRTLGELDLVVHDKKSEKLLHFEAAIKFYLEAKQHPINKAHYKSDHAWIGPNKIDRLDKKLAALLDRQLPLPYTGQAQTMLSQLNLMPDESYSIIKGNLFQHIVFEEEAIERISKKQTTQGWIHRSKVTGLIQGLEKKSQTYWKEMPKTLWLSPYEGPDYDFAGDLEKPENKQKLENICKKTELEQRPILLSVLEQKNSDSLDGENVFQEIFRLFVTPEQWP